MIDKFYKLIACFILFGFFLVGSCSKANEDLYFRSKAVLTTEIGKLIQERGLASTSVIVFYKYEPWRNLDPEAKTSDRIFEVSAETKFSCGVPCSAVADRILNTIGKPVSAECKELSSFHRTLIFFDNDMNVTFQFILDQDTNLIHVENACYLVSDLNHSDLNSPDFAFYP